MADVLRAGGDQGLLGICVGERSLQVAEVTRRGDSQPDARLAKFSYPSEFTTDNGDSTAQKAIALGHAVAQFLQWHGFNSHRAVIGVPAKWLICRPYPMPPADAETAANALWLHATHQVAAELGPMAFDYAGDSNRNDPTRLLLLGLQQRWFERVQGIARGAKLKIVSVTPCGTVLSSATGGRAESALILWLQADSAELIAHAGGKAQSVRHIGTPTNMTSLAAELRRAAAVATSGTKLVVWDDAGLQAEAMETIKQAANLPVMDAQASWVDVGGEAKNAICAVALTLAERNGDRPAVDFAHPRLTAPREKRTRGPVAWTAAAAAIVVLAALLALADLTHLQNQISAASDQLELLRPSAEAATKFIANTQFAESFQNKSPQCLACLRDVTSAIGDDGQTYLTAMSLRAPAAGGERRIAGEISGRSASGQNVVSLLDRLAAVGRFKELNCKLDPPGRSAGGNEVSFCVNFSYIPQT